MAKYVANTTIYENGRVYQKGDVINVSDERIEELKKMTVRAGEPMVVAESEYEGEVRETADAQATETTSATGTDSVVENEDPSTSETDYSDVTVYEGEAPTPAPTDVEEEDPSVKKTSENTNEGGEKATSEPTEESKEEPKATITVEENEPVANAEQESEYPKHLGGGWYELEDGTKVQGKDEAYQAMAEKKEKQ